LTNAEFHTEHGQPVFYDESFILDPLPVPLYEPDGVAAGADRIAQTRAGQEAVAGPMPVKPTGTATTSASVGTATKASATPTGIVKFYPGNNGFAGTTKRIFLMPGQVIDRYGGSNYSRFFSPAGTAEAARALPPGTAGQPLRTFVVVKPLEVEAGVVAPWFYQLGGGVQYVTPVKLETLLNRGIIKEVIP
jgi:hypothetical protein